MTTVIVVLVAVGLALLADAVVVGARRRALAKAHGRRSGAQESRRMAEVIDLEAARRSARPDERAATAERAHLAAERDVGE
jgi:hypothetical protein